MPSGLLIDLRDGGKAMAITAGLRCPSFGGVFPEGYQKNKFVDIAGFVNGSQVVTMMHSTAYLDSGLLHRLDSVSISGARVTQHAKMRAQDIGERDSTYTFPGSVWQIFPIGQKANNGLLISNSTDFTSITNATQSGQCIFMQRVHIPKGGWQVPSIAGYNKSQYVVFARWNNGEVLDYDGNTVRFYRPPKDLNEVPSEGDVDIVIFGSGKAPTPGVGLNITNKQGVCTFSTTKRPFVYLSGMWNPSTSQVNISNGYVPIGRFGLYATMSGRNYVYRMHGMRMQGGKVWCDGGKYLGRSDFALFGNGSVTGGLSMPVLPDMYL